VRIYTRYNAVEYITLSDTLHTCEADDHFNATADKPVVARYSIVTCAMAPANSYVLRDSFMRNMCRIAHWYVWHRADARAMAAANSCVLWHSLMCNMCGVTFWYVWHRTDACAMTLSNSYLLRESFMRNMCGVIHWCVLHRTDACAMALSNLYVFTRLVHAQYVRCHSLICVASRRFQCYGSCKLIEKD